MMTTSLDSTELANGLRAVARSLQAIAGSVRQDADAATAAVRRLEETADETATLAAALSDAAAGIERAVAGHLALLDQTIAGSEASVAVVADLRAAADGIGSLSATIGQIAGRSRLLALNARIEASRAGEHGPGFAVVAEEMGELAKSTLAATRDIEGSTDRIVGDVAATRDALEHVGSFVSRERVMIRDIEEAAGRQRTIAADVARLTDATRTQIDGSAAMIGRLSSSASAVAVMARQIVRAADRMETAG